MSLSELPALPELARQVDCAISTPVAVAGFTASLLLASPQLRLQQYRQQYQEGSLVAAILVDLNIQLLL